MSGCIHGIVCCVHDCLCCTRRWVWVSRHPCLPVCIAPAAAFRAENNYTAEIMICGGNSAKAVLIPGNSGATTANGRVPADYNCWRITPEAPDPTWTKEVMCNYPKCDTLLRR